MKKQLRKLSQRAYQRELEKALSSLNQKFNSWQNKEIDCWTLNELIHEYHDKTQRDLYKRFVMSTDHAFMIAEALHKKTLTENEIPTSVMGEIDRLLKFIKEDHNSIDKSD